MKQLAGIQLHESVNPYRKATEYNVGDQITIGGKWYDITAIEDGHYWISDEDGEEGEFNPGSEDNHIPADQVQEDGGISGIENADMLLGDAERLAQTMAKNFIGEAYKIGDAELASKVESIFLQSFKQRVSEIHRSQHVKHLGRGGRM